MSVSVRKFSGRAPVTVPDRIYHTPLERFFPSSIARQPRGRQYRALRLRKYLDMFPTPTFFGTDTIAAEEVSTMESRQRGV